MLAEGRYADAERVLYGVVGKNPRQWGAWHRLAAAELKLGKLENAERSARQSIAINPGVGALFARLGLVLRKAGKLKEAIGAYTEAVRLSPRDAAAWFQLGNALRANRDADRACRAYQKAILARPDFVAAYLQLAGLLATQQAPHAALRAYDEALRLRPEADGAWVDKGNLCASLGKQREAIDCYQQALQINPRSIAALNNLGNEARNQRRYAESLEYYDRALEIDPLHPLTLNNRGITLAKLERFDEACAHYRRALELKPGHANALYNLADASAELGDLAAALDLYQQAVSADPSHAEAHFRIAQHHLRSGDFHTGWELYEWRWKTREARLTLRNYPLPPWDGGNPDGKSLLIYAEQGAGDAFQFVRYLAPLQALGARVTLECPPRLAALLSTAPGVDCCVPRGAELDANAFDACAPLLSLPRLLGAAAEPIPCETPYLAADPARQQQWRDRLSAEQGFRVGIAWQGSVTNLRDATRSIPLRHFAPLAAAPGVRLFALQKGEGTDQLADIPFPLSPLSEELDTGPDGFVDTAAVMTQLDLVVTSDTSIAHLAGGLGVPVWVALSFVPEWRWQMDREDSPWYPTMRLFRQRCRGDWEGLFAEIGAALAALVPQSAG